MNRMEAAGIRRWMSVARAALIVALSAGGAAHAQKSPPGPYLKAELGYSKARDADFREDNPNSPDCFLYVTSTTCGGTLNDLGNGWTGGIGVGYRTGSGFRVDLTYNRRSGYNLSGTDPAGTIYDPDVTSDAFMLNGTYELPMVFGAVRPFIGGGIGTSRNEMDALKWSDPGCCSGTLNGGKKTDTAWQFTLGADIALQDKWTLEVLYRYTDMGKFVKNAGPDQSGNFSGSGSTISATGKLRANEIIVGVRFGL
jgi:opacity protein-like surface antigen